LSIKNDIEMVKEELNSEEKFFEKAVVTEKFVKKYKKPMLGLLAGVVLVVGGNIAYNIKEQSRITSANEVLAKIQNNHSDTASLVKLESLSPKLHDAWILSQAVVSRDVAKLKTLQNSKASLVKDVALYELAQDNNSLTELDAYALKEESIYKDLALVQSAVILMHEGKTTQAHEKLAYISTNSTLNKIATALMHYGVK